MTPQEHNKYLGISHLVYGGVMCLFGLLMMGMFGAFASIPGGPPAGMMVFMSLFIGAIYGMMTIPSFVAAYALLKQKPWAKIAAIIGGVTAASNFPIGTAICVYTFWFLFSEPGKALFDKPKQLLPPAQQWWAHEAQQRESQHVPPSSPPDWR